MKYSTKKNLLHNLALIISASIFTSLAIGHTGYEINPIGREPISIKKAKLVTPVELEDAWEDLLPVRDQTQDQQTEKVEEAGPALPNYAYLGDFVRPWEHVDSTKEISLNFDNAELLNLIKFYENEYGITFILDTILTPSAPGAKSPVGTKFSFKTEKPFNPKQAWDLFITFLDMGGLKVIPGPTERVYQLTSSDPQSKFSTSKDPVPTFIGVDLEKIPSTGFIRYVYFIQNASSSVIKQVADKLKSPIALPTIQIDELNALILTDKAANIKSILTIIRELDKATLPESLSVLKLQKADAVKVAALYKQLADEEKTLFQRLNPGGRKPSGLAIFTENVRVVADPRTNSLILLGPRSNINRIEDFIRNQVDKDVDLPFSPLHVYRLKYIDSETTAQIISELKGFSAEGTGASQFGGVLGGVKYIKPSVTVTAEKSTNSLIINADYDDFLQIYDLIQKIDTEQPQVAIRILVLDVNMQENKQFGVQWRKRVPTLDGVLGPDVTWQNSGLTLSGTENAPIVQNVSADSTGATRLLGNLIDIAGANVPGSTLLTLGSDAFGIWGLLKALQAATTVSVVSKPFLVTTHKYTTSLDISETRRVSTSNIIGGANTSTTTFGNLSAGLTITLTPQISPDGLILLSVSVIDSQFTTTANNSADPSQGNQNKKSIATSVILDDNQILALGGLTRDTEEVQVTQVPVLGRIPVLGWFFKNESKVWLQTSLLVLITAEIISPHDKRVVQNFTDTQMTRIADLDDRMLCDFQLQDPIHRWFFDDDKQPMLCDLKDFDQSYDKPQREYPPIKVTGVPTRRRSRKNRRNACETPETDCDSLIPNDTSTVIMTPEVENSDIPLPLDVRTSNVLGSQNVLEDVPLGVPKIPSPDDDLRALRLDENTLPIFNDAAHSNDKENLPIPRKLNKTNRCRSLKDFIKDRPTGVVS